MHLKMNTGLSGPHYCLGPGDEVPFDETFPFAARELGRHIEAGHCTYVGKAEDLDAWIAANPDPEPVAEAEPEAATSETPPVTEPAAPVPEVVTEAAPPVEPVAEAEPEAATSETPPVTEPAAPVPEVVTEAAPPVEPVVEAEAAPKARAKAAAKK